MTADPFKRAAMECPMADHHGIQEMKKPSVFDVFKFGVWVVTAVVLATVFYQQSGFTAELAEENAADIDVLQRDAQGNSYNIQSTADALDQTNEALGIMIEQMNANTAEDAAQHGRLDGMTRDIERLEDHERRDGQ